MCRFVSFVAFEILCAGVSPWFVCPLTVARGYGSGTFEIVRVLGVDYGAKRIGLALSDATGLLASPWKRLSNDGNVGGRGAEARRRGPSFAS